MQSEFPSSSGAFVGMERMGNPWQAHKAAVWSRAEPSCLTLTVEENPGYEYLLWVGLRKIQPRRPKTVRRGDYSPREADISLAVLATTRPAPATCSSGR